MVVSLKSDSTVGTVRKWYKWVKCTLCQLQRFKQTCIHRPLKKKANNIQLRPKREEKVAKTNSYPPRLTFQTEALLLILFWLSKKVLICQKYRVLWWHTFFLVSKEPLYVGHSFLG